MADERTCCVCGKTITGNWKHHQRLNVDVCGFCPMTDVMGEDITTHTLMWGFVETRGEGRNTG